jgi:hypothetical protein
MKRLFTEPFKVWHDITTNPDTGHYVAIDVFKALAFLLGCGLLIDAQLHGRSVEPALIALFLAFGLQNSKMVSKYFDRRTADGNGNPLTQSGTQDAPATPVVAVLTAAPKADGQEAAAAEAI